MRLAPGKEKAPALQADDWITVGVTHTIEVSGDMSWPKIEMGSRVRPGETADEAYERVSEYVMAKGIEYAEKTAKRIEEAGHQ
jgi:hypothetical protein